MHEVAGYGYEPWRAARLLAVLYTLGVVIFSVVAMEPTRDDPVYAFYAWVYSADVVIPLIDLKQASQWAPATTFGLTWMWISIVAGWVLSLALVAAVSGLFRED